VPLTHADLSRLIRATRQPSREIVQWLGPEEVDMTGEPETFVELPEGRRLMVLAWAQGGCRYLEANSCSVHASRPLTCALYPFDVSWGKRGGVRRLRLLDLTDCEHRWGAPVAQRPIVDLARAERAERVEYAHKVIRFNKLQRRRRRLGLAVLEPQRFVEWLGLS
jgi:Fe-S-cluster containining protein